MSYKYFKAELSNEDYKRMFMSKDRAKWCKHGLTRTRLSRIHSNMVQRCTNKKNNRFSDYGGRGIAVCNVWLKSRTAFFRWAIDNGYNDNLTIERVDNEGDYSELNCKFVTMAEQSINKRPMKRLQSLPSNICKRRDTGMYVVRINRNKRLITRREFSSLNEAEEYKESVLLMIAMERE